MTLISLLNSEDKTIVHESVKTNIKLILEDIRRIAEHASDIAEASNESDNRRGNHNREASSNL